MLERVKIRLISLQNIYQITIIGRTRAWKKCQYYIWIASLFLKVSHLVVIVIEVESWIDFQILTKGDVLECLWNFESDFDTLGVLRWSLVNSQSLSDIDDLGRRSSPPSLRAWAHISRPASSFRKCRIRNRRFFSSDL